MSALSAALWVPAVGAWRGPRQRRPVAVSGQAAICPDGGAVKGEP